MTVESWVLWVYSREQSREPAGNGSKTRRGKEGERTALHHQTSVFCEAHSQLSHANHVHYARCGTHTDWDTYSLRFCRLQQLVFLLDGYVHSNTTCSYFLQHSYMYMFRLCAHPRNMIRLVQLDHKTTPQFQTMFRITRKSEAGRAVLLRTFHSTTAVVV